ncbi:Transforming growth factor beta regulator 1 [Choanephora cucurbitarum]|uniref:Transforming growth factor beta regulator 1 n=1 Tax=Choanephora cucurbitarum TaxID=101091 RepID=A0A1C7NLT3_9FUNG|nr:Transforming growth factor beta regulator 1 [Choanephora cucurbitarum]
MCKGKVKIFYTCKGLDKHCLCSFDTALEDLKDRKWVSVPLKQCLAAVCSSCPDQLISSNIAVYSANFEESITVENWSPLHDSQSNIIWEGHGILSNILDDENDTAQVTGKIAGSKSTHQYDYVIEVLIQLHPMRHSPILNTNENQTYLPSMRSILSEPSRQTYSPPPHSSASTNTSSSSPPMFDIIHFQTTHRHHHLSPHQHHHSTSSRSDTQLQRIPSFPSTPLPTKLYNEHPNWHGKPYEANNYENQDMPKRKRMSSSTSPHQSNDGNRHLPFRKPQQHDTLVSNSSAAFKKSATPSITQINSRPVPTTTDTYFHQSRRKKRDTKPPNASDIRPFVEVDRAEDGSYILPAEVDSWTVLNLGTVIWDKAAFHNQRYIYPVGYRVKKWYRSMVDPHSDTQYTCEILDGGDEPIFQLNADDNPAECWRGPTPTTVWTIAVRRAFAIRNMDYGHNPVGPDFFGLRKNTIAKMIQDLPNACKCKNYIWQNFEAMNPSKGKSNRRANARIGPSTSTYFQLPKEESTSPNNQDE